MSLRLSRQSAPAIAIAVAIALQGGCVRVPEGVVEPEPELARSCPEPDRFAVEFNNTRVASWRAALEGDSEAPAWRRAWAQSALAQLEFARTTYGQAFERSCVAGLDSVETWARHRACFDEARAGIRERFELTSRWAKSQDPLLSAAPEWPWRLSLAAARCEVKEVASTYTPVDSARPDSVEAEVRALWVRTYALAELGDYAQAARQLADLRGRLAGGNEARLSFEANLLDAWLKLAAGDLESAEAALGPARTAAQGLGPSAQIDFAFFEGATAGYAGEATRAAQTFVRARKLAQALPSVFASTLADAAVQGASAWAEAEEPAATAELDKGKAALGGLQAASVPPALWLWAAELDLRLRPGPAAQRAFDEAVARQREALGDGHPSLNTGPSPGQ